MTEISLTKICTKCQIEKPVDKFSHGKREKDGFQSWCKACCNQYRQTHKEELSAQRRQYNKEHRIEKSAFNKQYYQNNKEELSVQIHQYYVNHKEEISERGRQRYKNNKPKILAQMKAYRDTPKGRDVAKKDWHKRRAQKQNICCEDFNPIEVFERDGYICQLCGKKTRPDYKYLHPLAPNLDHIIPLSKGGTHTKKNTQCLCRQCNSAKHNSGNGDQLRMFG